MATYTDDAAIHATLTGTTQDVVTLTGALVAIRIHNRHGANDLWAVVGPSDPGAITAAQVGAIYVPPAGSHDVMVAGWLPTVVRLLGNANPYSVQQTVKVGAFTPGALYVTSGTIRHIERMTQSEYDAIDPKDPATFYDVVPDP